MVKIHSKNYLMKKLSINKNRLATAPFLALLVATTPSAIAFGLTPMQAGALAARASDQPLNLFGAAGILTQISNSAMYLIGALAVFMLIFGGFKYVISGGDAAKVTAAKNTILYAIVGVVVATLAYAAIDFVSSTLAGAGGAGMTNL